jgi:hypothetical protein
MDAFEGDKAKFLPSKTYKDKLTLNSGAERIDIAANRDPKLSRIPDLG